MSSFGRGLQLGGLAAQGQARNRQAGQDLASKQLAIERDTAALDEMYAARDAAAAQARAAAGAAVTPMGAAGAPTTTPLNAGAPAPVAAAGGMPARGARPTITPQSPTPQVGLPDWARRTPGYERNVVPAPATPTQPTSGIPFPSRFFGDTRYAQATQGIPQSLSLDRAFGDSAYKRATDKLRANAPPPPDGLMNPNQRNLPGATPVPAGGFSAAHDYFASKVPPAPQAAAPQMSTSGQAAPQVSNSGQVAPQMSTPGQPAAQLAAPGPYSGTLMSAPGTAGGAQLRQYDQVAAQIDAQLQALQPYVGQSAQAQQTFFALMEKKNTLALGRGQLMLESALSSGDVGTALGTFNQMTGGDLQVASIGPNQYVFARNGQPIDKPMDGPTLVSSLRMMSDKALQAKAAEYRFELYKEMVKTQGQLAVAQQQGVNSAATATITAGRPMLEPGATGGYVLVEPSRDSATIIPDKLQGKPQKLPSGEEVPTLNQPQTFSLGRSGMAPRAAGGLSPISRDTNENDLLQ